MTKQLYLGLLASNEKNKTTLFHETLKVEYNNSSSYINGIFLSKKVLGGLETVQQVSHGQQFVDSSTN